MFYIDPYYSRSTSGARFFDSITKSLKQFPEYSKNNYKYVLINISTPLRRFIFYKLLNKKIVIRVDGNYSFPISRGSIKASNFIIRLAFQLLICIKPLKNHLKKFAKTNKLQFIFNLQFNCINYLKIYFSNLVIYQSNFSKESHHNIFPNKKFFIINNSPSWESSDLPIHRFKKVKNLDLIKICTSFHKGRPLKGFGDLLVDLEKIKTKKLNRKINLLIYGYIPNCFVKTHSKLIINIDKFIERNQNWINTYPAFNEYSENLSEKLISSDVYITYAQLDPCPNFVLEAIAHGLPIIGCDSGGVPEIVGNCGEILSLSKSNSSNYQNLNYEFGLKPPKMEELYINLLKVKDNSKSYEENIRIALKHRLSKEYIIVRYYELLKNLSLFT
tara:strand:+ start:171 stop:1331 length:1161 start_codon:yes stop_codon:yes gene_type:complete